MNNFEINKDGKNLVYTRPVTCQVYAFTKKNGKWYVLGIYLDRDTKYKNKAMKWFIPTEYLDTKESLRDCSTEMLFRQTGLKCENNELIPYSIDYGHFNTNNEHVQFKYYCILPEIALKYYYPTGINDEKGYAIKKVVWLPIDDKDSDGETFDNLEVEDKVFVEEIYNNILNAKWYKSLVRKFTGWINNKFGIEANNF